MKLEEIAQAIANNAGMPYVWEDVFNRLKDGKALPFKLKDRPPINNTVEDRQAKVEKCPDCDDFHKANMQCWRCDSLPPAT